MAYQAYLYALASERAQLSIPSLSCLDLWMQHPDLADAQPSKRSFQVKLSSLPGKRPKQAIITLTPTLRFDHVLAARLH